ncbi:hypothetical protein GO998_07290 [Ralstonia syzygii]|uniref:Secreted protein n=1 Tax=Ralstonia syzygii TaxID=28097 RepID=A0ABX7ZE06_9RALS|nr:hypothetical protein [Ralstonia syzygii]QUP53581.1 hypothetical protein GO998_07290 [Ralstonia syzygii]
MMVVVMFISTAWSGTQPQGGVRDSILAHGAERALTYISEEARPLQHRTDAPPIARERVPNDHDAHGPRDLH